MSQSYDYKAALFEAGSTYGKAKAALDAAESQRTYAIRAAHLHGRMSTRDIAGFVGLSHQRVAQIISPEDRRRTLHDAMELVLRERGGGWTSARDLSAEVWERALYARRDSQPVPPAQIRARAAKYPTLFESSSDGSGQIRLRAA